MLKLTEYEKGLLAGSEGKGKKKAMEFIVRYANAVSYTHLKRIYVQGVK